MFDLINLGEDFAPFGALREIAMRLDQSRLPYAVGGDMAMFRHGLRRSTRTFEILTTPEAAEMISEQLARLGYAPTGRRQFHNSANGISVRLSFAGQYPGDGKPKPVAFPDPANVAIEIDGIKYLRRPTLIELKLASGMTNPGRLKDLADVLELIRAVNLPQDFSEQLNPYVCEKFLEFWITAQQSTEL